ncbi:MAG: hypothetical protein AAGC60_00925 [Acidobacteriota bacterium]
MRTLTAYLPALLVSVAAYAVFSHPGHRRPLVQIESPIAQLTLAPGRHVDLDLDLLVLRQTPRVGACPTLSMHLRDTAGQAIRFFDHRLKSWLGSRSQSGLCVRDRTTLVQSMLDEPLPPGDYGLFAGLWEPASRRTFRLLRAGDSGGARRVLVAEVEVTDRRDSPSLAFDDAWGPIEPWDSGAAATRRSWRDAASLTLERWPETVELRLLIDLPSDATTRDDAPLSVACTGETVRLRPGAQEVRVQVPSRLDGDCQLRFPAVDSSGSQGGALDSVSWAPKDTARSR